MDEKTIKNNLSRSRKEAGISQEVLAERLHLNRNTYRNIETGRTRIINRHMDKIAAELGTSVEELILGYKAGDPDSDPRWEDMRNEQKSRFQALLGSYEKKIDEDAQRLLLQERRIDELKASLRDKTDLIAFQKEKIAEQEKVIAEMRKTIERNQ